MKRIPALLREARRGLMFVLFAIVVVSVTGTMAWAGESDLAIPDLHQGKFPTLGGISAWNLLFYGALVITGTLGISLYLRAQIHRLPAHKSMLTVAETIYATCKTYLVQQGKFLVMLFVLISAAMAYYFLALQGETVTTLLLVLLFSVVGMAGSYTVAWYGIRVNTYANCRTAFAGLGGQ